MLIILLPILSSILLGVIGQLLLKYGVSHTVPASPTSGGAVPLLWRMMTSPFVVGGIAAYGISMCFWLLALSQTELSFAYPFVSLSQVLVFFLSWLLLKEDIHLLRVIGMLVICLGVLLVARSG